MASTTGYEEASPASPLATVIKPCQGLDHVPEISNLYRAVVLFQQSQDRAVDVWCLTL